MRYFSSAKKAAAMAMAVIMALSTASPLWAAEEIAPSVDESYYATLDYYGAIERGSVVKTYKTYGASRLVDYGLYDRVTNLTDGRQGSLSDDGVAFDLEGDVPDKFYFEGETKLPFENLPWKISLSYRLNGVPTPAEKLVGEKGVVDIMLDVTPNPEASEYSRTNLVLTAASMFNGDDILSLEAEGAQVQLIGNLYCALFAVLPGEEQHFVIKVGTEDFSYSGMIFLAVPATLAQLEKVKTLREAKETVEDSLDAISDSLDIMLNTLDGMGGSLSQTANGLDALNNARQTISNGKGSVYEDLDTAIEASDRLTAALDPLPGHVSNARKAFDETLDIINDMNGVINDMEPEAENARKILKNLKSDLSDLEDALDDLEDKGAAGSGRAIADALKKDFDALGKSIDALNAISGGLGSDLSDLMSQLGSIDSTDNKYVTIKGMTVEQIETYVTNANQLYQAYQASGMTDTVTFEQFMTGHFQGQGMGQAQAEAQAAQLAALWQQSQADGFEDMLAQAKKLNETLSQLDMTVNQLKALAAQAGEGAEPVMSAISSLCKALGSKNLSGDLSDLCELMSDILAAADADDLKNAASDLKSACALGERLCVNIDDMLGLLDELNGVMNAYRPGAQQALAEAEELAKAASNGLSALSRAMGTAEGLMKESGSSLDKGAQQTLSGLSNVLRKAAGGLNQTAVVKNAKNTVEDLIRDQWDEHTGDIDNLLLLDGTAAPHSMTDERNGNVSSIQYIMRTREITKEDADKTEEEEPPVVTTTFWQRIGNMFKDMWNFVTGIFKRK